VPAWLMQERVQTNKEWLTTVDIRVKEAISTKDAEWEQVLKTLATDFDTEATRMQAGIEHAIQRNDRWHEAQARGEQKTYQRAHDRVREVLSTALPKTEPLGS
jgi:hypothetical protein